MSKSDVSAVVRYFATVNEGFSTTLSTTVLSGATTVPLSGVTGLVDGSVFVGIVEPGATNQQAFTGTVDVTGVQITAVKWTRGANVDHAGGKTVVDYTTGTAFNMLTAGLLKQHNQDGSHGAITATGLTVNGQNYASLTTGGWNDATETWTYSSNQILISAADVTLKYPAGTKIRLTQSSTLKYFYVTKAALSGSDTLLTINAGSDYTLANSTITSPGYSYADTAGGFPEFFNFTPAFSGMSGTNTLSHWSMYGKRVFVRINYLSPTVTGSVTLTLPVRPGTANSGNQYEDIGSLALIDSSGPTRVFGRMLGMATATTTLYYIEPTANTPTLLSASAPFTWAINDQVLIHLDYSINDFV